MAKIKISELAGELGCESKELIAFLQEKGIRVLRFWNNEVLQQTKSVLEVLWREVNRE